MRSIEKMLKDGVGHCYDQVEIEREWFLQNGYKIKTFWIYVYQPGVEDSGFSHTYLLYKANNKWNLFEHSDFFNRGIYVFKSIKDAVKWQADKQIESAKKSFKPLTKYVACVKEYKTPPKNINMQEYLNFVDKNKEYVF